ncbi:hypothetical protein LUZ63_004317 [Rhynchospora breviuscula]|uniref:Bifunctional inhibitor/plant lipid transfer protein/seed storage helical domain-containing protein n=1 Tax=Rhynchospora breviuscula TaxID=2022672 RepID=A0A9Q0D2X2_9POAL|nr:hypothetical protein LUZ63_004317 [Rhynchospora breviuscula]
MEKIRPIIIAILLFFSNSMTNGYMMVEAQTLCLSQFALATEACSTSYQVPGPAKVNATKSINEIEPTDERHHHHHPINDDDPQDTPCCRRLTGIDNACMCQILARLPKFITKPKHTLTLSPIKGCDVSFECDGI